MKGILKLALFLFLIYALFGLASWVLKKAIFLAIIVGVVFLVFKFISGKVEKAE